MPGPVVTRIILWRSARSDVLAGRRVRLILRVRLLPCCCWVRCPPGAAADTSSPLLLLVGRRPARRMPAGRGAVVGLRPAPGCCRCGAGRGVHAVAVAAVGACWAWAAALAWAIAFLNAGSGIGLGHGSPRSIASSPGVLIGGLSDGMRPPKSSNIGQPRPLFDVGEDRLQLGAVQGLLLQQLAGQRCRARRGTR